MDSLVAAAGPAAVKLVTLGVEDLVLANNEGASEVPVARIGVMNDFGEDLGGRARCTRDP